MIESVPACAPTSPPLTGASSNRRPRSRACASSARAAAGAIVLMSMTSVPRRASREHAAGPRQHELDVGSIGQHRHHDLGLAHGVGNRIGGRGALRGERVDGGTAAIEHVNVESRRR